MNGSLHLFSPKKHLEEKIRVMFFISSLEGGGAERVMVNILSHIDKKRIEPILVLLYPFENSPYREFLSEDVKVAVVKRKSDNALEILKQLVAFMKVVHKQKPQAILSMLTHNNIMAILAGMIFRIRTIICEHIPLSEVIKTKEGKKILIFPVRPLVKILYRFANRIITVSEGIKSDLVEKFNISDSKIKAIYNPINFERINKISADTVEHPFFEDYVPIVIAIGRLAEQKNFTMLIRAFGRTVTKLDARLIILGEGPERAILERLIVALGLSEKVSLVGFQSNPYSFLSNSDVFVLSSLYEGLPMVILEAMACGLPVISTDCKSGPREILKNGRYGLLVPVGDEVALSEGILKLLKEGELRERLARLGKERAMEFSTDKIIKQYENVIYESIVSQDTRG